MSCAGDWWDAQQADPDPDPEPEPATPHETPKRTPLIRNVLRDLADYQPA